MPPSHLLSCAEMHQQLGLRDTSCKTRDILQVDGVNVYAHEQGIPKSLQGMTRKLRQLRRSCSPRGLTGRPLCRRCWGLSACSCSSLPWLLPSSTSVSL